MGRKLVRDWLANYVFAGREDAAAKADEVARFFSDDDGQHGAHSLGIHRDQAKAQELVVEDLEDDPQLQDAVLSVCHATMHTLNIAGAVKIVENHIGRLYVKTMQQIQVVPQPAQQ